MGLLIKHGKIEYVDKESLYRMTHEQAIGFLLFIEAEKKRHEGNITQIDAMIADVKRVHKLSKMTEDGYYVHKVDTSPMRSYEKWETDFDD